MNSSGRTVTVREATTAKKKKSTTTPQKKKKQKGKKVKYRPNFSVPAARRNKTK